MGKKFLWFTKIKFGEINIENIAFSEPYIESEEKNEEKSISIKLNLRDDCKYEYIYENEDDNGKSFELYFLGDNSSFYYQCNKAPFLNNSKGICNFDFESYKFNEKGIYKYANYNPLFKKILFKSNLILILIINFIFIKMIFSLIYM